MSGSFTVGLLEILAYLVPGAVVFSVVVYKWTPLPLSGVQKEFWAQIAFLVASYVVGHLLTVLSVVLRMREILRRLRKTKTREQRMTFYGDLREKLQSLFGNRISRSEEYQLSLQLVVDNLPHSNQEIGRLYALTLFCRNLVVAFFVVAILLLAVSIPISLVCVGLSLLFFFRYVELESATSDAVFRAAYVYIKERNATRLL